MKQISDLNVCRWPSISHLADLHSEIRSELAQRQGIPLTGQHVESVNDKVTPILGGKSSSYISLFRNQNTELRLGRDIRGLNGFPPVTDKCSFFFGPWEEQAVRSPSLFFDLEAGNFDSRAPSSLNL